VTRQDSAQVLALGALGFLAGDDEAFGAFLSQAGTDAAGVRARAGEPELLAAVLDHLLADEPLLLAFCRASGHGPEPVLSARAALPGGAAPHWT
jgi:Protein of unknown function (DUF3572)